MISDRRPRRTVARRPSGRSVRLRTVLIGGAGVVAVLALIAVAWLTPLLSVRTVAVVGNDSIPREQVVELLGVTEGKPLLQVDTAAAAQRVASIPRVASVRVQRVYPSTVRVTVSERAPVLFFDSSDGTHLLDADAVDYAVQPPPIGTPRLMTGSPKTGDPATVAALGVLTSLPPDLRGQVREVAASSRSNISLTLHDGRVLVWGSGEKSDRKAAVALPLLTQAGQTYDVSSPDLPTVK